MIIRRRSQGDRLKGPMVNPITPSAPIEVSNVFGPRPFSPHIGSTGYDYDFHRGVDFPNAPEGTPCYAASSGAVIRKNYTHFHWKNSNQLTEFNNDVNTFNPWTLSITDRLNIEAESEGSADWDFATLSILKAKNAVINSGFDNYVLECKLQSGFFTTYGEVGIGLVNDETGQYIHLSYNGSTITIRGVGYGGELFDNATEYSVTGAIWLRIEYDFATDTTSWQHSSDGDTWVTLGSEAGFGFSYIPVKPILTWSGYNAAAESGIDTFEVLELNWIDENQTIGRFGNWVTINREEGKVLQVHLSTVDVNLGDFVSAGTLIGTIGRTGFNTRSGRINGVHAHLEWSDVTIAAYSQDEALNPLNSTLLPRVNVSNNISLILSEENDPDADAAWKIDVEVLRADADFDFNSLVINGNAASKTIDFNLRTGLNPDNDIPTHDGVYIVPADGFTHLSPSYQCTFYVKKSAIGSASIHVEAFDCNGILCDSSDLSSGLALKAKYNGGKTLTPGTLVGDYYENESSVQLAIDAGYTEGMTVGNRRMYTAHGIEVGTVIGSPGTTRRNALLFSDSDYVTLTLSANAYTFLIKFTTPTSWGTGGARRLIAPSPNRNHAMVFQRAGTQLSVAIWSSGGSALVSVSTPGPTTAGTYYAAATLNGANRNMTIYLWDNTGTLVNSNSGGSGAAVTLAGNYLLGKAISSGSPWSYETSMAFGWDGLILSETDLQAIVNRIVAGDSVDTIFTNPTLMGQYAALPTDGMITGVCDPNNLTTLYTSTGSGAEVTAEY